MYFIIKTGVYKKNKILAKAFDIKYAKKLAGLQPKATQYF